MIDVALYKWGSACFELGLNTVDEAFCNHQLIFHYQDFFSHNNIENNLKIR